MNTITLLDAGRKAFDDGKYVQSKEELTKAIEQLGSINPEDSAKEHELATLLVQRAKALIELEEFDDAQKDLDRALEIYDKVSDAVGKAATQHYLGMLHLYKDEFEPAESNIEQALSVRRTKLGADNGEVGDSLNALGLVYWAQKKDKEAEAYLNKGLGTRQKVFGKQHKEVADSLSDLAVFHNATGNLTLAELLGRQALTMRETLLGEQHPDYAESLYNMAVQQSHKGKPDKAAKMLQQSLAVQEATYPEQHRRIIMSKSHLAACLLQMEKTEEAASMYKEVIRVVEKHLGSEHQKLFDPIVGLSLCYLHEKKYDLAEQCIQRALKLLRSSNRDDGNTENALLRNLSTAYLFQGKLGDMLHLLPDTMRAQHTAEVSNTFHMLSSIGEFASKHLPWNKDKDEMK